MNEIEQAIESLQNIIEYWTYKPTEVEAAKLAILALRAQQERENQKPCPWCIAEYTIIDDDFAKPIPEKLIKYCFKCGRKLGENDG